MERRFIIGLNDPGVPGDIEAWIVSSPMAARMRVVGLVISPLCAPFFDVVGAAVGDHRTAVVQAPFATKDAVTGFLFGSENGGAFDLAPAQVGEVVALRVRNIDVAYRHEFRGAFLAVAEENLPS